MKKLIITAASLFAAAVIYAAPVIFVVDTAQVYANYYKAKETAAQIQASVDQTNQELQKMEERRQAIVKELQTVQEKVQNPALAEAAKQKIVQEEGEPKVQELRRLEQNVQTMRQQASQRLEQNAQSVRQVLLGEIKEAVSKIAEAKKADFVIEKGICFFSKPEADLTQEVIAAINAGAPAAN